MDYYNNLILCEIKNNNFSKIQSIFSNDFIDNRVKKLIQSEYIYLKENKIEFTTKGNTYLKDFKVEKVILNAAGQGSRLRPLTDITPKPLIKVNGKPIIEQTIENIISNTNINEIYIIVWWLKEEFNYLIEKYADKINIVIYENPEALQKNNISTFEKVKSITANSFIVDGDIIVNDNIFRDYVCSTTLYTKFSREHTKEWVLEVDESKVKDVQVGGENKYYITGASFIDKETSLLLETTVNKLYKENENHKNMYWDELLILSLGKVDVHMYPINENDVIEIDNLKELCNIDNSYNNVLIDDVTKIKNIINEVFYTSTDLIEDLVAISGGLTNKAYKFKLLGKKYFIRIPNLGSNELVNRDKELKVYDLIKKLDIVEKIVYINANSGVKITQLINGESLTKEEVQENSKIIAKSLKKYHDEEIKLGIHFSPFEELWKYEKLCNELDVEYFENYHNVKDRLLNKYLEIKDSQKIVLCHNDYVCGNLIIDEKGKLKIIDWEYAGDNDIAFDIASLFSENDFNEKQKENFYNYYGDKTICSRVEFWIDFQNLLWSVWHLYIMKVNPKYNDKLYGIKRFSLIKN